MQKRWQVNEPFQDLVASLVAAISSKGETPEDSIGEGVANAGLTPRETRGDGLTLKRGPVKKPARALQKLVRVYPPRLNPPDLCYLQGGICDLGLYMALS